MDKTRHVYATGDCRETSYEVRDGVARRSPTNSGSH